MARFTGLPRTPLPGPAALPLVGLPINAMRLLADPIRRLPALRDAYGDVVATARNNPALVCGFGAERNRDVLSNSAVFDTDDTFFLPFPEDSNVARLLSGLPFRDGETARRHRRLLMPAFQKKAIEGYAETIRRVTVESLAGWPTGRHVDVARLLDDLVQGIALECFFGLAASRRDGGLGERLREVVERMTSPLTLALRANLPGTPYARLLRSADQLVAGLRRLFKERRSKPDGQDALSLILRAHHEDGSSFSDDDLVGVATSLFVAGYETQARTLTWTLFLLDQHPGIVADLHDEVCSVLGGDMPTPDSLEQMPLLERVIKESMRILSPVTMLLLRVCQKDTPFGPHTLPEGANVVLSPFVTHRDRALYRDPTRFDPSRWETIRPTVYEYLPFGAGPRQCIGAAFASQSLQLMLALILQRYRFALAPGANVSTSVRSNIVRPRFGLPMEIVPQDRGFTRQTHVRGDVLQLLTLD